MLQQSTEHRKVLNPPEISTTLTARRNKRGEDMKFSEIQDAHGVTLGALRQLVSGTGRSTSIVVKEIGDGYAIHYTVPFGKSGWLLSEHTMEVRGFARAETAFNVCRQLGLKTVSVELDGGRLQEKAA